MRTAGTLIGTIDLAADHAKSASLLSGDQISLRQMAALVTEIADATEKARKLVADRSLADLEISLRPGAWSVAECFDHLAQSARAFLPAMADAIADAPRMTANRRLRTGLLASVFIANLEPPYRIRFKVLPQLAPWGNDFESAWRGFEESQARLLDTARSAFGLAIDEVSVKSPVYARIRYNVYAALRMLVAHERRHLWQIKQIFETLDRRRSAARSYND